MKKLHILLPSSGKCKRMKFADSSFRKELIPISPEEGDCILHRWVKFVGHIKFLKGVNAQIHYVTTSAHDKDFVNEILKNVNHHIYIDDDGKGPIGSLAEVLTKLKNDDDVLLVYTDEIPSPEFLGKFIQQYSDKADIMVCKPTDEIPLEKVIRYGLVHVTKTKISFIEKPSEFDYKLLASVEGSVMRIWGGLLKTTANHLKYSMALNGEKRFDGVTYFKKTKLATKIMVVNWNEYCDIGSKEAYLKYMYSQYHSQDVKILESFLFGDDEK